MNTFWETSDYILSLVEDVMRERPADSSLRQIEEWCWIVAEKGFPGWQNRLSPFVDVIRKNPGEMKPVGLQCDKFYYF